MPQNDFLIFNQNNTNTLTQNEFQTDGQRVDGLQGGIARSKLHNKVLRQASIAVNALSRLIIDSGNDALDTDPEAYYTNLKSVISQVQQATEQIAGTVKFASNTDVDNVTPTNESTADDAKAVTLRKIVRGIINRKLIPQASQTVEGITRFATSNELFSANPPAVAVSADVLKQQLMSSSADMLVRTADKSYRGIVKIAQDNIVDNPINSSTTDNSMVPNFMQTKTMIQKYQEDARFIPQSTTTKAGKIRIATQNEANAGTDNTTAITPYLLKMLRESGQLSGVKRVMRFPITQNQFGIFKLNFPTPVDINKTVVLFDGANTSASQTVIQQAVIELTPNYVEVYYSSLNTGQTQVIEYY